MKFRCKVTDGVAMKELSNITTGISKLSKECVLRIVPRKLCIIISNDDKGPKKPFVWCELPVNFYFKEFNMFGVAEESNEIYLSVSTAMLARCLNVLKQNVVFIKIKLTNKQTPCLTIEIEQNTESTRSIQRVHDIPVEIILKQYWQDYAEPVFNDFHVSIEMPNLRLVKTIVESMKSMNPTINVSANKYGRLSLQIKTNTVSLSAHYPDLSVQSFAVGSTFLHDDGDNEEELFETVSATVDVKKFLMFLTGMQLHNARTICSIVHNRMVKFYLEQNGSLSLQYYLTQVSL
nr:checkpoint protein HUS1 [Onthophagus taurus]